MKGVVAIVIRKKRRKLINKYIAAVLKNKVKYSSYTYSDISNRLGVSVNQVKQLMNGLRFFSCDEIYRLSQLFNIPINLIYPPTFYSDKNWERYKNVTKKYKKYDFKQFLKKLK